MLNTVPPGTHMCVIYSSRSEVRQDIADFLSQSIKDGGIAHYFHVAESVYAPDCNFDKDRTLNTLKNTFDTDRLAHSGSIHYTGEMSWALDPNIENRDQLISYERAVNAVCRSHPFSAICQYDASKFEPAFLLKVMQAHPFMLVDGMITPSPFYQEVH